MTATDERPTEHIRRLRVGLAAESSVAFPFFVGCGRSGTTLIRTIFNEHPLLAIPRESHFIPILAATRRTYETADGVDVGRILRVLRADDRFLRWRLPARRVERRLSKARDLPDAIRRLYKLYAKRQGKPRYGDKTPNYATRIPLLAELFPEARFVHVIRDARNVSLSIIERDFGPSRFDDALLYWRHQVTSARRAGTDLGPDRYLEYRHEDLVADPERIVRSICSFLDLDFVPAMLRYYEGRRTRSVWHRHLEKPPTASLRDFRRHLGAIDERVAQLLVGDVLDDLGYDVSGAHLTAGDERRARVRSTAARARYGASRALEHLRTSTASQRVRSILKARRHDLPRSDGIC